MKKILEIGAGQTPYLIRYDIPWNTEDHYTAVDIDENNLRSAKEAILKHAQKGQSYPLDPLLVLSDASSLEVPDESVDEVVISNTLSAPIHHDWDRDGTVLKKNNQSGIVERVIREEGSDEDPFFLERRNMLAEALRVLKTGGVLSVYTDLIIYGMDSYYKLLEELKSANVLQYSFDQREAERIDALNKEKLKSKDFCCCFRAELLPNSEVHRFVKI